MNDCVSNKMCLEHLIYKSDKVWDYFYVYYTSNIIDFTASFTKLGSIKDKFVSYYKTMYLKINVLND